MAIFNSYVKLPEGTRGYILEILGSPGWQPQRDDLLGPNKTQIESVKCCCLVLVLENLKNFFSRNDGISDFFKFSIWNDKTDQTDQNDEWKSWNLWSLFQHHERRKEKSHKSFSSCYQGETMARIACVFQPNRPEVCCVGHGMNLWPLGMGPSPISWHPDTGILGSQFMNVNRDSWTQIDWKLRELLPKYRFHLLFKQPPMAQGSQKISAQVEGDGCAVLEA